MKTESVLLQTLCVPCACRCRYCLLSWDGKTVGADWARSRAAAAAFAEKGLALSSANSINWGRLAPQIVYYFSAYCDMTAAGDIAPGEKTVVYAVRSGKLAAEEVDAYLGGR